MAGADRPFGDDPALDHRVAGRRTVTRRTGLPPLWSVAVVLCGLTFRVPLLAQEPTKGRLLRMVGEGFRVRETVHFAIAYDTPYEVVRPLVGRLEGTYRAVVRLVKRLGLAVEAPKERLGVVLFARYERYAAFLGDGRLAASAAGLYDIERNVAIFCDTLESPTLRPLVERIDALRHRLRALTTDGAFEPVRARREALERALHDLRVKEGVLVERINRLVIQHEAAHQILYNLGVHVRGRPNPVVLAEGLACQFEVPQPPTPTGAPQINGARLGDFREALGVAAGADSIDEAAYREAVRSGRYLPLRLLLSDPAALDPGGRFAQFRYAQAWALVYDLVRHRPEVLGRCLERIRRRLRENQAVPAMPATDLIDCLGVGEAGAERAWVERMLKLRYDPQEAGR